MTAIHINQEWDFIITETHREKSSKTNRLKRESLFALQIILGKIERVPSVYKSNFLRKTYFALKKLYL